VEPSFANLVLLVNPAFEGARYLPIHALVEDQEFCKQPPIMISVTSANDSATGIAFPLGAALASLWEHGRNHRQKVAIRHTMGHIPWMRTHTLKSERGASRPAFVASDEQLAAERKSSDAEYRDRSPHWTRRFDGGAVLRHEAMDSSNPFWVVEASPEIINGHNGIYGDAFHGFIRKLVAEQLRAPQDAGGVTPRPPQG
jgi:hypothetical protein